MKVLFDAWWWVNGPVSNKQIVQQVVRSWLDEFPRDEVVLAVRKKDVATVRAQVPESVRLLTTRLRVQGLSAILELPLLARRAGVDATLSHNFTPLFGTSGVFIQDLLFVTNPEWFTRKELAYFQLMPLSARRANVVFSSSRSEGERMRRVLPRRIRIETVGLGLNPSLLNATPSRPAKLPEVCRFLLTVGRLNVRKNLEFTCRAAIASSAITPDFPLVIAGSFQGKSTAISPEMQEAIDQGRIVLLGYVSDAELAWLYSQATAFTFMTVGEGFGLPPLEALHFGARVIASDIPVMREVLGNRARFVEPTDAHGMSSAIDELAVADAHAPTVQGDDIFSWPSTVHLLRQGLERASGRQR